MSPHQQTALQSTLFLGITILLVILNGFFVAAEFALVTLRRTRVEELAANNRFGAKRVEHVQDHLDAYLSATQLGVTLASLGLGSLGEPTLAGLLEPHVGHWQSHAIAAALGFALITYFHIIIGELLPKWSAIQKTETIALYLVIPLEAFYFIFRLPIFILHRSAVIVARIFHIEPSAEGGEAHSEQELRLILNASHAGGEINASEVQLVNQVFNFAHQQAKEIMVPRPDVIFLSIDQPIRESARRARESGYTRFPLLIDGSPDEIVGMVHIRDLFDIVTRADDYSRDGDQEHDEESLLRGIARDLPRIPETKPIDKLLREFQRGRQHMAVVVDEYGGTSGIVTLEDIVEEIVGDIQDEFDRTTPELEPDGKDCYAVDARMPLTKLERALGIDGPADEAEVDTVGGWVLASAAGGTVQVDKEYVYGTAVMTVIEMAGRRVRRVRVCVPETARGAVAGNAEASAAGAPRSEVAASSDAVR